MKLAMIGLGKMGGNMAERLRRHGHDVVGFDSHATQLRDAASLEDAVSKLGAPGSRVCWAMVPAGDPTDQVVGDLTELLADGDVVVDGGNSNYRDSIVRGELLAAQGVGFVDCGTSGGVWGLENGYCLMVGGRAEDVAKVQPAFDALAPEGGFAHVGPVGAGHFTKMVHNGIEYGMMQAFAEGVAILQSAELGIDVVGALAAWRQGSVVRSWLLDLLVDGMEKNPALDGIAPVAKDSGEGRWTIDEAVRMGVPAPAIAASLWARFESQRESTAMKVVALLRDQFGGHGFSAQ
ncbi:MAG: phosphogluconate dehydrogenase (NAD(+)-dependent, decarboxylating) [Acidimicrobiales bacterium]